MGPITLLKITGCKEAAHPRHKKSAIFFTPSGRHGKEVMSYSVTILRYYVCHYLKIFCHLWPSYNVCKHINAFAAPLLSEYLPDTLNKFSEIKPTQFKETRNLWKSLLRAEN